MGLGYIRNDTSNNISNGSGIDADDLDGEFNAIEAAFTAVTGHTHDGTSAEGGPVSVLGPSADFIASGTSFLPKTDDAYDLGSGSFQFKDLYLSGAIVGDTMEAVTFTGDLVGNADSADVLSSPRTFSISGQVTGTATAFDGSGNISIPVSTLSATNLNAGTVPSARVSGAYTGITGVGTLNQGSISAGFGSINIGSSVFTGNGSGLTSLDADAITTGRVSNARLTGAYNLFTSISGSDNCTFSSFFAGSGSAGAPSLRFSASTDTGIYSPAIGDIGFSAEGVLKMTVSGAVFIYTSTVVSGNLDVGGNLDVIGDVSCDDVNADIVTATRFDGSGSGLTTLNASQLTAGTVPNARISGNYTGLGSLTGSGIATFGRFEAGTGSNSNPSITFDTDLDTGIYWSGANILGFATAGEQRLRIGTVSVRSDLPMFVNDDRVMVIDPNGSNAATSFEIGTILLASCDDSNIPGSNNVVTVRRQSSTEYYVNEGSGTVLSGTWRSRGSIDIDNSVNRSPVLVQRTG